MPEEAKQRKITKQDVKKIVPVYNEVLEYVYSLYSDEPSIIPLKEQVGRQIHFSVMCILLKVEVCSCQKILNLFQAFPRTFQDKASGEILGTIPYFSVPTMPNRRWIMVPMDE